MRKLAPAVLVAMLACIGLAAGSPARAVTEATPILDRTYQCAVFLRGGAYLLESRAHGGARSGSSWSRMPYAGVRTGLAPASLLAWVTSGKPTSTSTVDHEWDTFAVSTVGTVGVRREACRQTTSRVALTATGLHGGVAAPLGDDYECAAPRQVLVRVRAVLAAEGRLGRGDDFIATHIPVRQAKLAVRTLAGKPLAYAEVFESGRAKLFAASGCTVE